MAESTEGEQVSSGLSEIEGSSHEDATAPSLPPVNGTVSGEGDRVPGKSHKKYENQKKNEFSELKRIKNTYSIFVQSP